MTPPVLLAVTMRTGLKPSCWAVIFCRLPKRTLELVSDPVSATPSHPSSVPKNGYSQPVRVNASPSVASVPPYRVTKPSESMSMIVASGDRIRRSVPSATERNAANDTRR